ncbi:hypothetical protein D3C81_2034360 [compost metagenome]
MTLAAGDFDFHCEHEWVINIIPNIVLGTSCDGGQVVAVISDEDLTHIDTSLTSMVNELLARGLHFLFRSVEFFN